MTDDIRDSAVPFEDIIGPRQPDAEVLSPQAAMGIAARESMVIGPPYSIAVASELGDFCKLEVTRSVGGVPRSQSMGVSRRRTPALFADMCRRVWLMLLEEHEREAKP